MLWSLNKTRLVTLDSRALSFAWWVTDGVNSGRSLPRD